MGPLVKSGQETVKHWLYRLKHLSSPVYKSHFGWILVWESLYVCLPTISGFPSPFLNWPTRYKWKNLDWSIKHHYPQIWNEYFPRFFLKSSTKCTIFNLHNATCTINFNSNFNLFSIPNVHWYFPQYSATTQFQIIAIDCYMQSLYVDYVGHLNAGWLIILSFVTEI